MPFFSSGRMPLFITRSTFFLRSRCRYLSISLSLSSPGISSSLNSTRISISLRRFCSPRTKEPKYILLFFCQNLECGQENLCCCLLGSHVYLLNSDLYLRHCLSGYLYFRPFSEGMGHPLQILLGERSSISETAGARRVMGEQTDEGNSFWYYQHGRTGN